MTTYNFPKILRFLIVTIFFNSLLGCAGTTSLLRAPKKYSGQAAVQKRGSTPSPVPNRIDRRWWESWEIGKGLSGESLSSLAIIDGDKVFLSGDRSGALARYESVLNARLPKGEKLALSYRRASINLSLGNSKRSLEILSAASRELALAPDMLPAEVALLFGSAYREYGDSEQSLAWFDRSYQNSSGSRVVRQIIEDELELCLVKQSDSQLDGLFEKWQSSQLIRTSIGRERARRESSIPVTSGSPQNASASTSLESQSTVTAELKVGLLLPLSGKFQNLGTRTRNGVELAFQGKENIKLSIRDSGETSISAGVAAAELVNQEGVSVIIGPLISEQAQAVRDVVDSSGVYQISLSKRSDFVPGGRVFRLGVTADSQIDSLLEGARDVAGINSIVLVCSEDSALYEICELGQRKASQFGVSIVDQIVNLREQGNSALKVADQISAVDAQGVLFVDNSQFAADVLAAIPEVKRASIRALGLGNWDNSSHIANGRNLLRGAIFVSPFFADPEDSSKTSFAKSYKEKFREVADFFSAQGFDAASLVLGAAQRMGGSPTSFEVALRTFDRYEGLTGVIFVGQDGELRRKFAVVTLSEKGIEKLRSVIN